MTIYVGNLSYECTSDDIRTIFGDYGQVKSVSIPIDRDAGRSRGMAFVEMDTDEEEVAAIEALDGAEWMGRQLRINKARPRPSRGR